MKDHIWEHNNRYRIIPVEGQKDQFDLIPVPGTVYEAGTPINKATLLQDATYAKYKDASGETMPLASNAVPDDMWNALANAYANGISIIMDRSDQKASNDWDSAKWYSILYDATGKCTFDYNSQACTKLYIPKGIKKVQVTAALEYSRNEDSARMPEASIYKNGKSEQSLLLTDILPGSTGTSVTNTVINSTGNGSEYIQLYLRGEYYRSGSGVNSVTRQSKILCSWIAIRMLSFE